MFDAKSLIEMMVRGAAPQRQAPATQADGGLGDLLGQLGRMLPAGQGQPGSAPAGPGGGIEDLLRQLTRGADEAGQASGNAGRSRGEAAAGGMGGLGDILGQLQKQAGAAMGGQSGPGSGAGSGVSQGARGGSPNIMDILGQVLGQATSGVREGAGRIGQATGADEALGRMTGGQGMDDMLAKLKELIAQNQFGTGAAAGGLGAVILGTETGRSIAASAAKLGALALIGGLAYKAYTNYQAGKPLIAGNELVAAAPDGSGFEPDAVTNAAAILLIRSMIAAAAADGRVDPAEMANIVGHLKQAGFDAAAEEFIAGELNAPASAVDLAENCISAEQAVQVYTAARLAVTLDSPAEKAFLADLAAKLNIAPELAAHIEAAARNHG